MATKKKVTIKKEEGSEPTPEVTRFFTKEEVLQEYKKRYEASGFPTYQIPSLIEHHSKQLKEGKYKISGNDFEFVK